MELHWYDKELNMRFALIWFHFHEQQRTSLEHITSY